MKSTVIRSAAIAIALVVYLTAPAFALDKAPILSLDLAKKMAAGCEAKAKECRLTAVAAAATGGAASYGVIAKRVVSSKPPHV